MKIYNVQEMGDGFIFFSSELKENCYFFIINKFLLNEIEINYKNFNDIENMIDFIDQKEYEKAANIAIKCGWLKVEITSQTIGTSHKRIFAKKLKNLKSNLKDAKKIMVFK